MEQWLEGKTRVGAWTRRSYRDALDNVLLPRFGDWQVAAVDEDAIAKLVRDLEREGLHAIDCDRPKRPLSSSSITNYLEPLRGALAVAVRRGYLTTNPFRNLTSDERPRQTDSEGAHEWSDEEIEKLLSASAELSTRRDARRSYEPLLRTAINTGMRLGELLGLQWQDVDLDEAVIRVERQWTLLGNLEPPKTKAGVRRIPLGADMLTLFRQLKEQAFALGHAKPEDHVFASKAGTPLRHRNVQVRGFEAARDDAGLPEELSFHSMRHAFASMAAHRGVPKQVLSEVMGHANVGITDRVYKHLYDRESAEDAFRSAMSRAQSKGGGAT